MLISSRFPVRLCHPKAILARACLLHPLLSALLMLTLLLPPLPLQAGVVTCEKCSTSYNGDAFSSCPICHPKETPQSTSADDEFQQSQQLAIQLFTLAAQAQPDSNFVFSPDSLFQALSLILHGATGPTQAMLENYLRGTGASQQPSTATSGATSAATSAATPVQGDTYCIGNCLLLANRYQLLAAYREKLENINAKIRDGLDFTNMESLKELAQELNDYISQKTGGMIPNLCRANQWDPNTALSIINSVYFKGAWKTTFYRKPKGGEFTLSSGESVHLKRVMHRELSCSQYIAQNEWQAVTVPYQGDHEMVLVLPPEGVALSGVSPDIISNLLASLQPIDTIDVQLPAFETNTETDLNSVLTNSGLGCLFQPGGANLGAMLAGSSEALFLSSAKQHCAIKVNEWGTEAAAVIQTMFVDGGFKPITIDFNRPFLYILRHKVTGRILFIGQIFHPESLG